MFRHKNVQKHEKHYLVICTPIFKIFVYVKFDKTITALYNVNIIKIFTTHLKGVLMITF